MEEVLEPAVEDIEEKGLKSNSIGLLGSVTIGLASTAPVFSLAATLGLLAITNGNQSLAILLVSFVPMAFVAIAYRELNRVIPDCGTTFTWATKAFGPHTGWIGGWGLAVSGIIFIANAADIVGIYGMRFLASVTNSPAIDELADSKLLVSLIAVAFIAVMTWVNYRGLEGSTHMQYFMVGIQFTVLAILSGVAIWQTIQGNALDGASTPELSWLNPFAIGDASAFVEGVLLAIFIYWGWDSVLAVNEETADKEKTPGRAAILSTVILLGTYLLVTAALLMYAGPGEAGLGNPAHADDIFAALAKPLLGPWGAPVLILTVLISAAASLQTTIMPTARGTLAMAVYKALPAKFARISPRYKSPSFSTILMGIVGAVFYLAFKMISDSLLEDSILSIGLAIAFYYGVTAFAAAWYFRKDALDSVRNFFMLFLLPLLGGIALAAVFIKSAVDMWDIDYGNTVLFGIGGVFVMGVGSLLIGFVFMFWWRFKAPAFFRGETLHHDTPVLVPDE